MREILFRAKTINTGEWIQSMTIAKGTIKRKSNCIYIENSENKWVGVIPDTVGQFTGITDKNGVKIFEGDIIKMSGGLMLEPYPTEGVIKYNINSFVMYGKNEHDTYFNMSLNCSDGTEFEVIGNIHEK